MASFKQYILDARSLMEKGEYKKAFDSLVNRNPRNAQDLFNKIACLVDIGFVLRDEKILNYAIYLLENHGEELAIVPDYAPYIYLNLGHQYSNMGALYSFNDDFWCFYHESVLDRAKSCYHRALKQEDLSPGLKREIKASQVSVYLALGRRWEALEAAQQHLELQEDSAEALDRKCSLMLEFSSYNRDNKEIIQKEVWHRIKEILDKPDKKDQHQLFQKKKEWLDKHLPVELRDQDESYPSHSLETEGDFEHFYVSFCVKHRLYLNICSFCSRCDYALGDRAVFDSRGIGLDREEGSYYKLVSGYNRLKERYLAGRYILAVACWEEGNLDFAEMLAPRAKLQGFTDHSLKEHLLENAFISGWEILESIASLLALYMERPDLARGGLEGLFYQDGEVRDIFKKNRHPSLHAIYNIHYDLSRGMYRQLSWIYHSLRVPFADDLVLDTEENRPIDEMGIVLYRQIRNIMIYLISLFDTQDYDLDKEQDFALFPFHMPEELTYH